MSRIGGTTRRLSAAVGALGAGTVAVVIVVLLIHTALG